MAIQNNLINFTFILTILASLSFIFLQAITAQFPFWMNYTCRIIFTNWISIWTTSAWSKNNIRYNTTWKLLGQRYCNLLISQCCPSNSTLQSHVTFPVSCIRHLPPCLHKFSPCGKHRSICNNNKILMLDMETRINVMYLTVMISYQQ